MYQLMQSTEEKQAVVLSVEHLGVTHEVVPETS